MNFSSSAVNDVKSNVSSVKTCETCQISKIDVFEEDFLAIKKRYM